jgi:sugar phosphate isomerase/epimerase
LKHPYPFRLGCTSYVYPDEHLPNVEKSAPMVDDIEVVLFESLDYSNLPSKTVISKLAKLGKENDTTFTIHFPIDKKAGSADTAERKAFQKQVEEIMALTAPLDPCAFLLHLEPAGDGDPREVWASRARETCALAQKLAGGRPERICVENLGYPHGWNKPMVADNGFSYCFDVGHALRYTGTLEDAANELMPKTRVIHFHGWDGNKDHLSLARMDKAILRPFIRNHLKNYRGVLTLEVFSENETFESVEVLKSLWEK